MGPGLSQPLEGCMESKWFRLPASDFAGWAGFIVAVVLIIALAKMVPGVKRFV